MPELPPPPVVAGATGVGAGPWWDRARAFVDARSWSAAGGWVAAAGGVVALVESSSEGDVAGATGGTVVVSQADDACVVGTFTLAFGAESLTGAFAAHVCSPP